MHSHDSQTVSRNLQHHQRTADILARLVEAVPDGFVVGGAVRNPLLGDVSEPKDLDVICSRFSLTRLREYGIPGSAIGTNRHGNVRLTFGEYKVDVFAPQTFFSGFTSVEDALSFFDVNISAVAWPITDGEIVDPLGALPALRSGEMTLVENRWQEEPSPMERAVLRARLLKLWRRFPTLRCTNPAVAIPDIEQLFAEFPKVLEHHLGNNIQGAADELITRLNTTL